MMNRTVLFLKLLPFFCLFSCITGNFAVIPEESGSIEAFFCDKTDCKFIYKRLDSDAKCAFYHIDESEADSLVSTGVSLVVDEDHPIKGAVVEKGSGLMHDKFCVFDDFVWTGSWNPAQDMSIPNNAVLIQSKTLANSFRAEFDEMSKGIFHKGDSIPGLVRINGSLVEAYFCPEDNCKSQVIRILDSAKTSVHFMVFSFTDDDIGNLLVKHKKNMDVKGVFDPRKDKHSEYDKLKDVSVVKKVHHKVFIIDSSIVITGSFNPSKNANERNDENLVIIHNKDIAGLFEKEFNSLYS